MDTLRGTNLANILIGIIGGDVIRAGGGGLDTYSPEDTEADAVMTTRRSSSAEAGEVMMTGIENLAGGAGNDRITGDAGSNRLLGNSGADTLIGGEGDDLLMAATAMTGWMTRPARIR